MKAKIIGTILPTILGILTVLGLLVVFNLIVHNGDAFNSPDNGFFKIFIPIATVIALTIQFSLTLPFWNKFKSKKKVWGLTLFQFIALLCIISGLIFGLVFWEPNFGIKEFFLVFLTGIVAFTVYWTVNLFTLKQINKSQNLFKNTHRFEKQRKATY
jgi:membrane protease YdiL (CAAX protease family)